MVWSWSSQLGSDNVHGYISTAKEWICSTAKQNLSKTNFDQDFDQVVVKICREINGKKMKMIPSRRGLALLLLVLGVSLRLGECVHFDVKIPYPGEIFDTADTAFEFTLVGLDLVPGGSAGVIVVTINGVEATRTANNLNSLQVPGRP
jgi:hypothetical protein